MKNKANTHGKTRIALASILLATLLAGCGGVSDKDLKAAENVISARIDKSLGQDNGLVIGGIEGDSSAGWTWDDYNLEYLDMKVVDKDGQGRYLVTGNVRITSGSREGAEARVAVVLQDYNGHADFCHAEVIADVDDGGEHEEKVLEKLKEMNAWGSEVSNPPGTDLLNYLDARDLRGMSDSLTAANYILTLEEHEVKLAGVTEEDIDKAAAAVAEKSASMTTEDGGIFTLDGEPDSDGHGRYLITTKVVLVGSGYNCKAVRMVAPDVDKEFALAFKEGSIATSDLVNKANETNEIWTVYCQQGEEQELADAMKGSSNWGLEGEGLGAPTSDKDKNEKNLAEKVASFLVGWYDYEDLKSKGDGQGRYLITGCSTTVGDMMRETDYFWTAVVSFKEGFLTDEHIKEWKDTNGSQEERFELLSQWAAEGNVLVIGPNPVKEEVYYDGEENAGIDDMKTKARWGWPSASGFSEDSQAEFLSLLHSTGDIQATEDSSLGGIEEMRESLPCSYAEEIIAEKLFYSEPSELEFQDTNVAETDGKGRVLVTSKTRNWQDGANGNVFITAAIVYLDASLTDDELKLTATQLEDEGKIASLGVRIDSGYGIDLESLKDEAEWGSDAKPSLSDQQYAASGEEASLEALFNAEENFAKAFAEVIASDGRSVSVDLTEDNGYGGYGRYLATGDFLSSDGSPTGEKFAMIVISRGFISSNHADSYSEMESNGGRWEDTVELARQWWKDAGSPTDIYVGPTFYTDEDDEGAIIGDLKQKAGWGQPYNQAN